VQNYGRFLASLGFSLSAEEVEHSGLGLALGNSPVSLAQLATAFTIFPRDGKTLSLRFDSADNFDSTDNFDTGNSDAVENNKLAENANSQVISADTARLICSILSDHRARLLAFGRPVNFETPFPAIFKTGTANQFQSIVALGATPRFTAAVWMGNFTGETVIGRTGSSLPASVVRSLLLRLHSSAPVEKSFREPVDWIRIPVCALSGLAPLGDCPSVIEEYFPSGEGPGPCTWHAGGLSYPPEYQSWFLSRLREGELDYSSAPLEIISPRDNYSFLPSRGGENSSIPVEVIGGINDELEVDHNGRTFTVRRPFVFFLPYTPGRHNLTVSNGNESDTVQFTAE